MQYHGYKMSDEERSVLNYFKKILLRLDKQEIESENKRSPSMDELSFAHIRNQYMKIILPSMKPNLPVCVEEVLVIRFERI